MNELGRIILTDSIMLSKNEDGSFPQEYFIKSVIGQGGSAVCYEAVRKSKDGIIETGKLKEFYPIDAAIGNKTWYYNLERLPNGQLVPGTGTIRKFNEMCNEYINTYKLLWKVMADNPQNEILKSYIQYGEILYGCMDSDSSDDRRPTVYIWSPGFLGKGFDKYLAEVRNSPYKRPESKLHDILYVIYALTDCIKALHTAGLMHLDIKPSNFLVQYDSDFNIRPDSISLFDINTLCSVDSGFTRESGSEGYCAPEVLRGKADNRSDIYSIGAMLFNAVVISEDIPDGLYRNFFYPSIKQLVKNSALFLASKVNSDSKLKQRICKILEKCLDVNPRKRYQSCTELRDDLNYAIKKMDTLLNTTTEKNVKGLSEPIAVIQKLLYEHPLYESPLYETEKNNTRDINVLVIGSGDYAEKFIDVCMQSGQMYDVNINITAMSGDSEADREAYLCFRPAIGEFVNVNGSLKGREQDAYASLEFRDIGEITKDRFIENAEFTNRDIVRNLIGDAEKNNKKYHYVFIALGNDNINKSVADLCRKEIKEWWNHVCPVCYILEKKVKVSKAEKTDKMYPVYINETIYTEDENKSLGEMAFNTHIAWNSSLNMDVSKEREKFFNGTSVKEKYNRMSSLAFVLSIKYKLHSVNIDCSDPTDAALKFSKQILEICSHDEDAMKKFTRLVDLEHRRWLIEKATDGWTAPRDKNGKLSFEGCIARRDHKDNDKKTHPCMVRGSETSPLSSSEYSENNHYKWDNGDIDPSLDELDRMSIELHRYFRKHVEELQKEGVIQNSDLEYIEGLIPKDCKDTERAFKQYGFALKNIINGVESYSRQYDYYHDIFESSLDILPEDARERIKERLKIIKNSLYPVIENNLYRDYKAYDEVLVKKIPFILTYRYMQRIALPFEDGKNQNGRNEAVFANVAAATVLSPEKICYLYCFDEKSDLKLFIRKLDAVMNYLGKRKVRSKIDIVIACMRETYDKKKNLISGELNNLRDKYSSQNNNAYLEIYKIFKAVDNCEAVKRFMEYFSENPIDMYGGVNQVFDSAYDNASFIRQITDSGVPYFEFDCRSKVFTKRIGCEHLRFLEDSSFIRVHDMFALMNAADNRFNLPEFANEYEDLWNIYTGRHISVNGADAKFENGVKNWNRLCDILMDYEKKRAPLAKIKITSNGKNIKTLSYYMPEFIFRKAKSLLHSLIEYGIAEKDSSLVRYASDTYRLDLKCKQEYVNDLSRIFEKQCLFMPDHEIEASKETYYGSDYVVIKTNDRNVSDVNLNPDGKTNPSYSFRTLRELENKLFITNLRSNESNSALVSFSYSSARIKELLTCAGEILEIYTYYDILKTGYFDDVACGYEFYWEYGDVKNELDIVLTKGFKSIIVECKAVKNLKLDFYHKLHSIADQFGIGTTKVLLGNTYSSEETAKEINTMQRNRGNQLNIITISDRNKIINIGNTLMNLIKES